MVMFDEVIWGLCSIFQRLRAACSEMGELMEGWAFLLLHILLRELCYDSEQNNQISCCNSAASLTDGQ